MDVLILPSNLWMDVLLVFKFTVCVILINDESSISRVQMKLVAGSIDAIVLILIVIVNGVAFTLHKVVPSLST